MGNLTSGFARQLPPCWHTLLRKQSHAPDILGTRGWGVVVGMGGGRRALAPGSREDPTHTPSAPGGGRDVSDSDVKVGERVGPGRGMAWRGGWSSPLAAVSLRPLVRVYVAHVFTLAWRCAAYADAWSGHTLEHKCPVIPRVSKTLIASVRPLIGRSRPRKRKRGHFASSSVPV